MVPTKQIAFYDEHPFDWVPADGIARIQSLVSAPLIDLIDTLDQNSLILDIGCGPGRVLGFLVKRGLHCIGIDRSVVSINLATSRYSCPGAVADNLCLPFPDAIADIVISDGVIHHTQDPRGAFAENLRVLKPGGRMYLGVYKPFGRYPLLYKFPGCLIRRGLFHRWSQPLVVLFAQVPYFLVHFIRSRGKRTWAGSINLFYDYFVTPRVAFLGRQVIEEWSAKQTARVVRYDENRGQNVHSFLLEKEPRSTGRSDPVNPGVEETRITEQRMSNG